MLFCLVACNNGDNKGEDKESLEKPNTAYGHRSLNDNTTGGDNVAIGKEALRYNTTASYNTAVGTSSLKSQTGGDDNTAIGHASLYSLVDAWWNTNARPYISKCWNSLLKSIS